MTAPLVSFGLPIRNGAATVGAVAKSVLDQDHGDLRARYHRQRIGRHDGRNLSRARPLG